MPPVIDIHTHMLTDQWVRLLEQHGGPRYALGAVRGGLRAIHLDGAPFMTPVPAMFDWDLRIRNMDEARVDVAVVSLTCPNVFWGDADVSATAARFMNDAFAKAQTAYPGRIGWFCSLPWQHPPAALEELARALAAGARGVMVLANIAGQPLTDPLFEPIWRAIDEKALPVLVHPTAPPGVGEMGMHEFQLTAPIGFTFDTSLAIARCILDGFLDRWANLKLIAAHGAGALPFLIGRLDICWDQIPATRAKTAQRPSHYMHRVFADTVVFTQDALEMCIRVCGSDNVLYGSDYPHTIGDMAGCLARVDRLAAEVGARVRGRNARRLFGL